MNQVRVCYKRYLQSFEELYKTLGCTFINHPRGPGTKTRHGSGRPLVRGVRSGSKIKEEDISDRSSISSQESGEVKIKEEIYDEIDLDGVKSKSQPDEKKVKKTVNVVDKIIKDEPLDEEVEIFDQSKKFKDSFKAKKGKEEVRMLTRPRRDSSSSLAAASELKAKKDEIGETSKIKKEIKKEPKKVKDLDKDSEKSDSGSSGSKGSIKAKRSFKKKDEKEKDKEKDREKDREKEESLPLPAELQDDECSSDVESQKKMQQKKLNNKKKGNKTAELAPVEGSTGNDDGEEPQHLKPAVECSPGDKIKVFWLHGQIYEAKIIKVDKSKKTPWPRFYVHYQGWNQRYDEWITRGRIAENLTWNQNPLKQSKGGKSVTPPPDKQKNKEEKGEKRSSDEEKLDSDDKNVSEEEKDSGLDKKKIKKARSSTPSSTPSSSRTSSPAHNKRTKSPASKRAGSPKEKSSQKEKKILSRRTNSPVQRNSPQPLKRQSSRSSLLKQSDDDLDMSDEEEDEKVTKRANKIETDKMPKRSSRSGSIAKAEQRTAKVIEPDEEGQKKTEQSRSSSRLKASNTPIKKSKSNSDSDDPYVFQEPEPLDTNTFGSKCDIKDTEDELVIDESKQDDESPDDSSEAPEEAPKMSPKLTPVKNRPDNAYVAVEKMDLDMEKHKTDDAVLERKYQTSKDVKPEAGEEKSDKKDECEKSGKPVLQLNDRYASLFPHLASLRTSGVVAPAPSAVPAPSPPAPAATPPPPLAPVVSLPQPSPVPPIAAAEPEVTTMQITSATMINHIVESSILKESIMTESKPMSPKPLLASIPPLADIKQEEDLKDSKQFIESPPKQKTKNKKKTKLRSVRNPAHKSREVVTDSDTDSDEDKPKPKPVTPSRRKTIESERNKTPMKRAKPVDSDDDECSLLKRLKKKKDDENDSLVCQETIPGSPVHSGTNEPSPSKINTSREERNSSSRLEMPFASVPESSGLLKANLSANASPTVQSLKNTDSPPATPDSSNSIESPSGRQPKFDGSKSPAESSEVDMESLSGRGKAGSEDSRLDIECSSSSDTRLGRARRTASRQPPQSPAQSQQPSKEAAGKEKEQPGLAQSFKKKRKVRGEGGPRGRGKGRGRNSSGVGRTVGRPQEDTDDSEKEARGGAAEPRLDRLDNAALAALAAPKPNSTSKYNFYVMLSKYCTVLHLHLALHTFFLYSIERHIFRSGNGPIGTDLEAAENN